MQPLLTRALAGHVAGPRGGSIPRTAARKRNEEELFRMSKEESQYILILIAMLKDLF